MSFLHYWDYKYLCKLEQKKTMTKLYLDTEEEIETYWKQTSTYGDDIEVIYFITE